MPPNTPSALASAWAAVQHAVGRERPPDFTQSSVLKLAEQAVKADDPEGMALRWVYKETFKRVTALLEGKESTQSALGSAQPLTQAQLITLAQQQQALTNQQPLWSAQPFSNPLSHQ